MLHLLGVLQLLPLFQQRENKEPEAISVLGPRVPAREQEAEEGSAASLTAGISPMPSDRLRSISSAQCQKTPCKKASPVKSKGHAAAGAAELLGRPAPRSQALRVRPHCCLCPQLCPSRRQKAYPRLPTPSTFPEHPWSRAAVNSKRIRNGRDSGVTSLPLSEEPTLARACRSVPAGRARSELIPGSRTMATHCGTYFQGRAFAPTAGEGTQRLAGVSPCSPRALASPFDSMKSRQH